MACGLLGGPKKMLSAAVAVGGFFAYGLLMGCLWVACWVWGLEWWSFGFGDGWFWCCLWRLAVGMGDFLLFEGRFEKLILMGRIGFLMLFLPCREVL